MADPTTRTSDLEGDEEESESQSLPPLVEVMEEIGFGRAHVGQALLSSGSWFVDGAELVLLGCITWSMSKEFNLDPASRGSLVSMVMAGIVCGTMISGPIADFGGRRLVMLLTFTGVLIFSVASSFTTSFTCLICIRFFVGTSIGLGIPATTSLGVEIMPLNKRIVGSVIGQIGFSVGGMAVCFMVWLDDPQMKELNWRQLLRIASCPAGFFLILNYFTLYESPNWLALRGRYQEAKAILQRMCDLNGCKDMALDFEPPQRSSTDFSLGALMTKWGLILGHGLGFTTVVVSFAAFTTNFVAYGGVYAFPLILPKMELALSPATNLGLAMFFEIPGYLFVGFMSSYIGRKAFISTSFLCIAAFSLMFAWTATLLMSPGTESPVDHDYLEAAVFFSFYMYKGFPAVVFTLVYVYSAEVFPSDCRSTGVGLIFGVGKMGAVVAPLVYEAVTEATGMIATFFYVVAGLAVLSSGLVMSLPRETSDKLLKDYEDETEPLVATTKRRKSLDYCDDSGSEKD